MSNTPASVSATLRLVRQNFLLDVSIEIPSRGITALFGMSGSGKTTLLRCIAGLEKADSGELRIGDELWQTNSFFLPVHKRSIGYVFQESNLFEHLTVMKNLCYGYKRIPESKRKIPLDDAITLLGIGDFLQRMPAELSGGQRQRVAIARALLASPRLLLMDEPLASLDLQSKAEILPYLETLPSKLSIPIIYVSHSPDEVVRIADHMVLLDNGQVQAQGAVNDLLTRTDLPLAHLDEACAVIKGRVIAHERHYHLTYLEITGGKVAVSYMDLPIGYSVRIRILARDVSLALQAEQNTSISNVFPVRINSITPTRDPAKVLVKLDTGGEQILAQITARSVDTLQLSSDQIVYAQVKSVALMRSLAR